MTGVAAGALRLILAPARFVADRVAMRFAAPLADLAPGEGAIVDVEGEKVAAYRDPDGTIHALSPVCTHVRCIVSFNARESTWDCPCHGSRFTTEGEVVKGPARRPLERKRVSEEQL